MFVGLFVFLMRRSDSVTVTTPSGPGICYGSYQWNPTSNFLTPSAGYCKAHSRPLTRFFSCRQSRCFSEGQRQGPAPFRSGSAVPAPPTLWPEPRLPLLQCRFSPPEQCWREEGRRQRRVCCTETLWFWGWCCGRCCRGGRRSGRWVGCCSREPRSSSRGGTRRVWSQRRGENRVWMEPAAARRSPALA